MITQVKFVSIPTSDQQRALLFYTEKLGFQVATDQAFRALGRERESVNSPEVALAAGAELPRTLP